MAKTPLQELEEYFGGSSLPRLGGSSSSTAEADLFEALKIMNGVTDDKLDTTDMRKQFTNRELDDIIEGAQGPSKAMATLLYYFVKRSLTDSED